MARIKLPGWVTQALADRPEDGMGFHLIDLTLSNGDAVAIDVKVFNGEDVEIPDEALWAVLRVQIPGRD